MSDDHTTYFQSLLDAGTRKALKDARLIGDKALVDILEGRIEARARKLARRHLRERAGLPPRTYRPLADLTDEQRAERLREQKREYARRARASKNSKPAPSGPARAYCRLDDLTDEEKRQRKADQDRNAEYRRRQKRLEQKALANVPDIETQFTDEEIQEVLAELEREEAAL